MKKNVNVFIAVLLVAVLCGGVIWLQTADEEKLGWNIHDSYGDTPSYSGGAAYTNATFAGPSAGEGGVMPLSSSSALRARTSYSYAGAYALSYGVSPASSPNSLIASSPLSSAPAGAGLYTTSSKTFNSYGGGGNGGAAMGGAMSNGRSNSGLSNPSLQGGAGVGSISPIAYSTARRGEMSGGAGVNPAMMAAENPMVAMASAANAANTGMNTSFYGGMYATADYSSADYGQYSSMFGGGSRIGVRGRQNAQGFDDLWWVWFDTWANSNGNGDAYKDENGNFYFDDGSLRNVYDAFIAGYWNSGMGEAPSFEDWLDWYKAAMAENGYYDYYYGDELYNRYYWVPVGDILPLLLIALLYLLFVAIKSKSLKSLLKTERSE